MHSEVVCESLEDICLLRVKKHRFWIGSVVLEANHEASRKDIKFCLTLSLEECTQGSTGSEELKTADNPSIFRLSIDGSKLLIFQVRSLIDAPFGPSRLRLTTKWN